MVKSPIEDIACNKINLSEALLRSELLESRIKNETFKIWLRKESEGYEYMDGTLPPYRKVNSPYWLVVSDVWGRS